MPINENTIVKLEVLSGTDKDNTGLTTPHYTDASNIRFYNGRPQKLGGNDILSFEGDNAISGCGRTIYSQIVQGRMSTLIGTHLRLYALFGTTLTNITPLLSTLVDLGVDPFATTNLSATVVVTQTAHSLTNGDTVIYTGATATNGIPASELNTSHVIANTTTNTYEITVTTPATSTGSGGGSVVIVEEGAVQIPNSLDSDFTTLALDPIATVSGSTTLTVTSTGHSLQAGDTAVLAGSTAVNGVPAVEINKEQIVRSVATNSYTIIVTTAATSTGSGGSNAVTQGTGIITVNQTAHSFVNGDRVKIQLATAFAGLSATEINAEHIIRNVGTNAYDIVTTTEATSSVTGGGGAFTTSQGQVAAGQCDAQSGVGYGMGEFNDGLYSTAKTSSNLTIRPRIWSFDRFGNNVVMTAGGRTALYQWTGSTATAPTKIPNAPEDIDYVFVSNNIVVTLTGNRIRTSNQGEVSVWADTEQNRVFDDEIEGADDFISHASVRGGTSLLFTNTQIYTFQYVDLPIVWAITKLDAADGLIAQNARTSYNGVVYFQGNSDYFLYNGGITKSIPSNAVNRVNYVRNTVFNDLNEVQKDKAFSWYNKKFSEIWFHSPSSASDEPDMVARFSVLDLNWVLDDIDRTAAENMTNATQFPYLIDTSNNLRRHEKGVNDDTLPLSWSLTTPSFQAGNTQVTIEEVIPDSIQTGDINFNVTTYQYIQDVNGINSQDFPITPTTPTQTFFATGRNWKYTFSQDVLDGDWRMGTWSQVVKKGTPQ